MKKLKRGELTIRQMGRICKSYFPCCGRCPFNPTTICFIASNCQKQNVDEEIEIDDEGEEYEDAEVY